MSKAVTDTDADTGDEPPPPNPTHKSQIATESVAAILPYAAISARLRRPESGSGDDDICRWLYDAFHSESPALRLAVLRHVPLLAGLYLSRAALRRPLPGFEAVLLALYAREAASRAGQPVTVLVPDVSHPSLYHEPAAAPAKSFSTALNPAVVSPALEPCGTVRSTRRARIVGVALELYYGKLHEMPKDSKLDFCHVCMAWAGGNREINNGRLDDIGAGDLSGGDGGGKWRSIQLPWELMQPILRILGHCIVGYWANDKEVCDAAKEACRSLHVRAIRDMNAKAILAAETLLRLGNLSPESAEKEVRDDDQVVVTEFDTN